MQKTLADLENKGYLRLEPDPEDRRAKHVRLSKIGIQRQNSARVYLRNLEQELRTRLGARTVTALSDALQAEWGDPSAIETD
jgi:DNA-binding MarR family transcriptional regulator